MSEKTASITKMVSFEDLKEKKVSEQFQVLEDSGYQRGIRNPCCPTCIGEWNLILEAAKVGHIAESYPDLLSVEKCTVPFVLRDENGAVIDEYNYVRLYYWDTDPARLIAECWIRGGEHETVLTMPLMAESTFNGMAVMFDDTTEYTLTAHDIKCCEERIAYHYSDKTKVAEVSNGRFVLATNIGRNRNGWAGFPACGDGDEAQYKTALIRSLVTGIHIEKLYEVGQDDSMTFPTEEAAYAWAERIGIKANLEVTGSDRKN